LLQQQRRPNDQDATVPATTATVVAAATARITSTSIAAARAASTVATIVGVLTRNWPLLVVVAGGEVGLQGGRDLQVGVPQPVHGQRALDLLPVDLHQAAVDCEPRKSTTGSSTSASVLVCGPKPVASASSASAMVEADSTLRKTVARLCASFQISDRAASRLQCSVARIAAFLVGSCRRALGGRWRARYAPEGVLCWSAGR
jgi:hypothetical protein